MTNIDSAPKPGTARSKRGFAAMDPATARELSSRGGKAAHASGKAHKFTSDEARQARAKSPARKKAG